MAHINPRSFSVLRNLTTLLLDFNFIQQTLNGKEFEGLGQIQEIHLSNNHWKIQLSSASFINVPNLRVLTLGKSLNSTTLNLDPSPFQPLSNLTYLDLSNNNIANIRESMLKGLGNLKVLKLQHNNLARLWKDANPGGPVLYLKGAEMLTTLWMDNNGLDEIPQEALRGLTNLRELSLSNNLLDSLKDSVFDDLKSLQILRLQKNMITAVKPEVFRTPMRKLSLLVMDKNPFDCTDNTPFYALYLLSSTTVLMLMVTALLVRFHGWRIQFYWNVLVSRTLGFSDASVEEGREFEFDAYIIHAERDTRWVEREMVPLENENCKFYLEDRDAVAGVSVLQSIMENMKRSRKIVFVVTESLLRDPWCRQFKAQQALHQVIEASRDSVVLVFLQDVHDYKLSRTLYLRRGMLRPCCILDWPEDKERVPAFRQKLLIALGMTNRFRD
ncbi:unnamed protein product [Pleuronectes platessa]|uniref:TIR domain-containing protein n=1 Tax=Pleuronectes platessa TaxID=8262 RepID=A0A9N7V5N3_PLEPL|nr:unnamed protein product [Pleuronectes platessa]